MSNADTHQGWEVGQTPWVQSALEGPAENNPGYAQCYFCGQMTAKLSITDVASDTGRVDVYCNNTWCEAREMTVLVIRDGARAFDRADTRLLAAIDNNTHSATPDEPEVLSFGEQLDGTATDAEILARRVDGGPAAYASPGRFTG